MKKILVMSDTHMPRFCKKIPDVVMSYINEVDFIFHTGDFQTYEVYQHFSQYKKVIGVLGNRDDHKLSQLLPRKLLIDVDNVKIGLFHGHGLSVGMNKGTNTLSRTLHQFKDDHVDLIIFGHSHIPLIKKVEGVTLFNPGSPTNKRRQPKYSFGILTIHHHTFDIEHIFFDSKE